MNASLREVQLPQEPSTTTAVTEDSTPALAPVAVPAPVRAHPVPTISAPRGVGSTVLGRLQTMGHLALAEVSYRLRRLGAATVLGIAAVVAAATLFLASNLPQSAAVAALNSQLARQTPLSKGAGVAVPAGALLAALPARAEAPNVVAKILEEAQAAGVELPRGQSEYVPARDGVAARYRMTFPVHATYPKIRAFMDRTLVALPAVAVEGLRIERKSVGDDSVEAELKLAAYVRSDP